MSAEVVETSSSVKEQQQQQQEEAPVIKMETSLESDPNPSKESAPEPTETVVNETNEEATGEQTANDGKGGKRKRSTKKPVEIDETSISNSRPKRAASKREEPTVAVSINGSVKTPKTKGIEIDDEQEREKNLPIGHDVADVVWVKMGGHPWWPSLIVRDPNDPTQCFTKVTGNARAKRMFFVVFYGSTADFAWVSDAAIIPYKGVEAFTQFAQEMVDKAQTKSQKEQLTERFQLKVTIGRREDWEAAVREADKASNQTSEKRLEEIEPKVQFYTSKLGQNVRKGNFTDLADRSDLAEKIEDFGSEEESTDEETSTRKNTSVKLKLRKQSSNENDSSSTPPAKRRNARKSNGHSESTVPNGSHDEASQENSNSVNGSSAAGKKRGRPRLSKPSVITNNGETPRKTITKPQAFMNEKFNPSDSFNRIFVGQHHRFDIRTGFLSPFEEKQVFDAVDQLRSTKTFEEAEKIARQRFEQILCVNLNKTHADIPQEWFYSFLFAHPILIIKNPHWFDKKLSLDDLKSNESNDSLENLKHQLIVLSKLYRNELKIRSSTV